jgi:hypothetical protein
VLPTFSDHRVLSAAELESLLAALGDAIDRLGGGFILRHVTVVATAARR